MYAKIVNPKTGRKVSIKTKLGQNIIRKYLNVVRGEKQFGGKLGDAEKQQLNDMILHGTTAADGSQICNPDLLCHPLITTVDKLKYAYKLLSRLCHPDKEGGSTDNFTELGEIKAQMEAAAAGGAEPSKKCDIVKRREMEKHAQKQKEADERGQRRAVTRQADDEAKAAVEQDTISYADYKALSPEEVKAWAKFLEQRRKEAAQAQARAEAVRPQAQAEEVRPQAQAAEKAQPQTRAADSPLGEQPQEAAADHYRRPRAAPRRRRPAVQHEVDGMEVEEQSPPLDKEAAAWQEQQWQQQQKLLWQQAQQSSGFGGASGAQPSGGLGFAPQQSRGFGGASVAQPYGGLGFAPQQSRGFGGASGAQPSGGLGFAPQQSRGFGFAPPVARQVFRVPAFAPPPSFVAGFERSRRGGPSYGPSTPFGNPPSFESSFRG